MMYNKEEAKKAVKILFFEGAGCVERGDVENCRIRTAFRNDEGKGFYLELSGIEKNKFTAKWVGEYMNGATVDYCYELDEDGNGDCNETRVIGIERKHFEYSKDGIIGFVNRNFNCSFDAMYATDWFFGYRVHGDNGKANFMDDFNFDFDLAERRRNTYNDIDASIRRKLQSKYSKISLIGMDENSISIRYHASDEELRNNGIDPNERTFKVRTDVIRAGEFDCSKMKIGDLVEEEIVDHFMNVLPPACMRSDCSQLGEPYSHREDETTGKYRATYMTFKKVEEGIWQYCGHCFRGENIERGKEPVLTNLNVSF